MAYKIDKDGRLIGDGLPDGATINMEAYQKATVPKNKDSALNFYPSMQQDPIYANAVSKFKRGADGKIYGFVPEMEKAPVGMVNFDHNKLQPKTSPPGMASLNGQEFGQWIEISGIALDQNSRSGETNSDFTFRMDGGAPLAVFGSNKGYMRLATQQQKAPDSLALGNQLGTTQSSVRQNARRRTLL